MQTAPAIPMTATAPLERLVAFDTANRNPSLTLSDFGRNYLDRCGVCFRVATIIRGTEHIARARQPAQRIAESEPDACRRFIRRPADRLLV